MIWLHCQMLPCRLKSYYAICATHDHLLQPCQVQNNYHRNALALQRTGCTSSWKIICLDIHMHMHYKNAALKEYTENLIYCPRVHSVHLVLRIYLNIMLIHAWGRVGLIFIVVRRYDFIGSMPVLTFYYVSPDYFICTLCNHNEYKKTWKYSQL